MTAWLIVIAYVLMMVATARAVETDGSRFFYGLLWPLIWVMIIWKIATGQFRFTIGGRVVYRGKNFR
jgi:hypothetical protein